MTDKTVKKLEELEMRGDFIRRHIGPDDLQIAAMLNLLGLESLDDIIKQAVPDSILSKEPLSLLDTISRRMIVLQ